MKHHNIELGKALLNLKAHIKTLEETNGHFSTQIGKLTDFLTTQDFNPLHLGRSSIDVAIDEIKRLKVENKQLKKELVKVKMRGM